MDYWTDKEKRKEAAAAHTAAMETSHGREIAECIKNSKVYGGPDSAPVGSSERMRPHFYFVNTDSVSALKQSHSDRKAVLNFASYKNPGGMFLKGSGAQEEMLCHGSFLYNVLRSFRGYYAWNNEHKNRALYTDRAIYTPGILFEDTLCDVITCAAPNIGVGLKYNNADLDENRCVLDQRMCFIRDIAEENGVETLILGAFGCGVFKQDPEDVCRAIESAFRETSVWSIVLAVPGSDRNYQVFSKHFGRR